MHASTRAACRLASLSAQRRPCARLPCCLQEGGVKMKLLQKWDRRYFVLGTATSTLSYYKSDDAFRKKEPPLGTLQLGGESAS